VRTAVVKLGGQIARSEEKQRGAVQNGAGKDGVLMVPFIGPEEERSKREVGGGECSFKVTVFKDGTGEEEAGRRPLDGGFEGDRVVLCFSFIQAREGGHRR
jgi:hypothetical protein